MPKLGVTEVAELCHEMIGLYREAVEPDYSFSSWSELDTMTQGIMRDLVKWIAENPDTTPENVHTRYKQILSDALNEDNNTTRMKWEDLESHVQRRFFIFRMIVVSFKRYP